MFIHMLIAIFFSGIFTNIDVNESQESLTVTLIAQPSSTDVIVTVITTDGTATGTVKIIVHYIMYNIVFVSSCIYTYVRICVNILTYLHMYVGNVPTFNFLCRLEP